MAHNTRKKVPVKKTIKAKFWSLSDKRRIPVLLVSNFFLDSLGKGKLDLKASQTMFLLQLLDNAEWMDCDGEQCLRTNIGYEKLQHRLKISSSGIQKRAWSLMLGRLDNGRLPLLDKEIRRLANPEFKTKVFFDLAPLMCVLLQMREGQDTLPSVEEAKSVLPPELLEDGEEGMAELLISLLLKKKGQKFLSARKTTSKWPPKIVGKDGHTPVAQEFLMRYRKLGMSDTQALIFIQRLRYYSKTNNEPAIRNKDLADKVNINVRQLQKLQKDMDEKGFLTLRNTGKKGYPVRTSLDSMLKKLWP